MAVCLSELASSETAEAVKSALRNVVLAIETEEARGDGRVACSHRAQRAGRQDPASRGGHFYQRHFHHIGQCLLQTVAVKWIPTFTAHERATLFDQAFTSARPSAALATLVAALQGIPSTEPHIQRHFLNTIARLLFFCCL